MQWKGKNCCIHWLSLIVINQNISNQRSNMTNHLTQKCWWFAVAKSPQCMLPSLWPQSRRSSAFQPADLPVTVPMSGSNCTKTAPKACQKWSTTSIWREIDGPVDTIIACQIDYVVYWEPKDVLKWFRNAKKLPELPRPSFIFFSNTSSMWSELPSPCFSPGDEKVTASAVPKWGGWTHPSTWESPGITYRNL